MHKIFAIVFDNHLSQNIKNFNHYVCCLHCRVDCIFYFCVVAIGHGMLEEMLAYDIRLLSMHCKEFPYSVRLMSGVYLMDLKQDILEKTASLLPDIRHSQDKGTPIFSSSQERGG